MAERTVPEGERGAALLTVLLLVAVMAVITAVALERLTIATRMAQNGVGADQGRALLIAGEEVAAFRLGDLVTARPGKTTLAGNWLGTPTPVAVPGGRVIAQVSDAGNCFNLNSLVTAGEHDSYVARPTGIAQFATLMRLLGIDSRVADRIAMSSADWIDSDVVPAPGGAEDDFYLQQPSPHRAAGGLLADPSELRAVRDMTPALYARLKPWICALPMAELSPINVNTLLPDQGVLLAMVTGGRISPDVARQVLARRPADGYGSLVTFWGQPPLAGLGLSQEATDQAKLTSRWFSVDLRADLGDTDVTETALFDAQNCPAQLVRRHWGDDS